MKRFFFWEIYKKWVIYFMIYDYRELFFPKRLFLLLGDAGWWLIILLLVVSLHFFLSLKEYMGSKQWSVEWRRWMLILGKQWSVEWRRRMRTTIDCLFLADEITAISGGSKQWRFISLSSYTPYEALNVKMIHAKKALTVKGPYHWL